MRHVSIRVEGRVQGVFYRASTRAEAERLGLKGIVKNNPDGSVYIEVEGNEELVEALIDWCRTGPPHARVEDCVVTEGKLKGYNEFRIER